MALTLKTYFLDGLKIAADAEAFPVVVELASNEPVHVAEKIDVVAAWLDATDGSDVSYGFSASGRIGTCEGGVEVTPKRPEYRCVDVLQHDEQRGAMKPGKYNLSIEVCVFVERDGEFKAQTLAASSVVEIAPQPQIHSGTN